MFPIESFRKTLLKIVEILRSLEIPFHLTGGVTSVAYGEPRLTQDIDIVLQNEATARQLDQLLSELEKSDFMFNSSSITSAVKDKRMFQLFDLVESLKLDMYPREMIPGELNRSENAEIFEQISLPIVSRTDAAASKLVWISKGSHKSRRDFRQIVKNLNAENLLAVEQMANNLGLSELMQTVLEESDEIAE